MNNQFLAMDSFHFVMLLRCSIGRSDDSWHKLQFISMLLCCSKMAVVSYYFFFFLHLLVAVIFIFAENAAEDIHYSLQFCWTYFTLHANFMLCMNMASVVDKSIECLCIYGVIFLLSHYGITSRLRFLLLVLQDPDVYNGEPFLLQSCILTEGTSMTSLH